MDYIQDLQTPHYDRGYVKERGNPSPRLRYLDVDGRKTAVGDLLRTFLQGRPRDDY